MDGAFELKQALGLFLDFLRVERGASRHTLSAYESDLNQWSQFVEGHGAREKTAVRLAEVNSESLKAFLEALVILDLSPASQARKVSALKQFFKYCVSEKWRSDDPTEGLLAPKRLPPIPKALGLQDLQKLLEAADEGLDYRGSASRALALKARDRAMIYLLYATGLRVSELLSLKVPDLDLQGRTLRVQGKRNKQRIVPFAPAAAKVLQEYWLDYRGHLGPKGLWLYLNPRGEALSRQGFWEILNKIGQKAGLTAALSPHVLRHTFATHLLHGGIPLRSLQLLLGHSDLGSTQVYTAVAAENLAQAVDLHHPRSGISD